jgi:NAD(P)-dependent dehydrogenase (short-subunit alcohol dehydrogenase family)
MRPLLLGRSLQGRPPNAPDETENAMACASDPAAIVTGGASGIGRATVEAFLEQGWSVLAVDLNPESGTRLIDELADWSRRGRLAFSRADVSDEADVSGAVTAAVDTFGGLDAMVNNAGVGGAFGPITEIEVEDWDYTFAVLCRGVFLGTKHAARAMQAAGRGGSIINIGSVAALIGDAGPQAYSAAKAAVVHLSKVTAGELAPHRIRVNAVCPGFVSTALNPTRDRTMAELAMAKPWPDEGTVADLADVITFLAGDRSRYVTGQAIAVDGGLSGVGPRIGEALGLNSRALGVVGVNRGSTGARATVRRKLTP